MKKKNIYLGVIIFIIIGSFGFFLLKNIKNRNYEGFEKYNNKEAGYLFQYPNYFEYNEKSQQPNFIFFVSENDGADIISVKTRVAGNFKTVQDWLDSYSLEGAKKIEDIKLGGEQAMVATFDSEIKASMEDMFLTIVCIKNNKLFEVELRGFDKKGLNQFIDNFRFSI